MHFYKTTPLTHTITQWQRVCHSEQFVWFSTYTQKRAHLTSTGSACSRLASHCLQKGVKLYSLTSGTLSLYFGFKAEIALQWGNDVILHRESESTQKKGPYWTIHLLTNHKTEEKKQKCITSHNTTLCEHTQPRWLCFPSTIVLFCFTFTSQQHLAHGSLIKSVWAKHRHVDILVYVSVLLFAF